MVRIRRALIWTIALAISLPLLANDDDEYAGDTALARRLLHQGERALEEGDCKPGFKLLRRAFHEDPGSIEINYSLGRAAYCCGNYEEALFAYERVLIIDPLHPLARLEKARTHLALGAKKKAKQELEDTLELDIPNDVYCQIKCLLTSLEAPRKHTVTGMLSIGHTWDSNVTLGTRNDVALEGTSLNAPPTARSDNVRTITCVVNHSYPLACDGLTWSNQFIAYLSDNEHVHTNDLALAGVDTTLNYLVCRHTFTGTYSWQLIYLAENLYQNNSKWLGGYDYRVCDHTHVYLKYAFTRRHHYNQTTGFPQVYGLVGAGNTGLIYAKECHLVVVDLLRRYDKTPQNSTPPIAYYRSEMSISYTRVDLPCDFSVTIKGLARQDRYQNLHAVFTTRKRRDETYGTTLTINKKVAECVTFTVIGDHTRNHSNIDLNKYTSSKLTTQFSATF